MKLTLNKFHVQDIQFAEASSFCHGVLYINKAELAEYLMEDTNIHSVDFDIARPGESVRIVPIKDVVQPRYKQSGTGQVFPGFVGDVETVGNGETNVLEDCAVATVEGAPTAVETRLEDPHHASIVGMCSRHSGPACPPVGGTSVVTLSGSLTAAAILRAVYAPPTASSPAAIA